MEAPVGALDDTLRAELQQHKAELLALLTSAASDIGLPKGAQPLWILGALYPWMMPDPPLPPAHLSREEIDQQLAAAHAEKAALMAAAARGDTVRLADDEMPASTPLRMPLTAAREQAAVVLALLRPACARVEIAGSIRRRKASVKDIELVAIPTSTEALDARLASLVTDGALAWNVEHKGNGPRYKRLVRPLGSGATINVDLFLCAAANWGNTFAIRTGDADFTRLLLTRRSRGGVMPEAVRQHDGYLWRSGADNEERIDCLEEADFFHDLGVEPVPEPSARTGSLVATLVRRLTQTPEESRS